VVFCICSEHTVHHMSCRSAPPCCRSSVNGTYQVNEDPSGFAVVDECPECKAADLDFQNNFGGRDPVNWVAVQCDIDNTPFVYSFQV